MVAIRHTILGEMTDYLQEGRSVKKKLSGTLSLVVS
jgi:hypothetical protein